MTNPRMKKAMTCCVEKPSLDWTAYVYEETGYDLETARLVLRMCDNGLPHAEDSEWMIYCNDAGEYLVQVTSHSAYMTDFGRAGNLGQALEIAEGFDAYIEDHAYQPDPGFDAHHAWDDDGGPPLEEE